MDTEKIKTAADRIAKNQKALEWLEKYGAELRGKNGETIKMEIGFAESCPGFSEATYAIESYGRFLIPEMVAAAIRGCSNTIVCDRNLIREELE